MAKILLRFALSAGLVFAAAAPAALAEGTDLETATDKPLEGGIMPVSGEAPTDVAAEQAPGSGGGLADMFAEGREVYAVFKGTVEKAEAGVGLSRNGGEKGVLTIRVKNAAGDEADFVIDGKAVVADNSGLADNSIVKVGSAVAAYYLRPQVMTLQYPPRYIVSVVLVGEGGNLPSGSVGVFKADGLAVDKSLKLNIATGTKIVGQNGEPWAGGIANQTVIAYYAVVAQSLPPQASPNLVVVLDKLGAPVFAKGERLLDYMAYTGADGVTMVPLRAICEALGYDVVWDEAQNAVRIGAATTMQIGKNAYTVGRMVPLELEAAPVLINDRTYVPASFFTKVLHFTQSDDGALDFTNEKPEAAPAEGTVERAD